MELQNSGEIELYLSIINQAIQDYLDFAKKSNPANLSAITSLHKNSPACILVETDWWHPTDFCEVTSFFKSSLLKDYLFSLNIDTDYFFKQLRKKCMEELSGMYDDLLSVSYRIDGVGNMNPLLMQKHTLDLINEIVKKNEMIWKTSDQSYIEITNSLRNDLPEEVVKECNFWNLSTLQHIETLFGVTSDQKTRMYLGCFSREIEKTSGSTKGPGSYKKYLLLIIGENQNIYEIRNAGKIAKTIYTLYFNEEQKIQRDLQEKVIKFLESIKETTGVTHELTESM